MPTNSTAASSGAAWCGSIATDWHWRITAARSNWVPLPLRRISCWGRIPAESLDRYVARTADEVIEPLPRTLTFTEVDHSLLDTYVCFDGVRFAREEIGLPFCDPGSSERPPGPQQTAIWSTPATIRCGCVRPPRAFMPTTPSRMGQGRCVVFSTISTELTWCGSPIVNSICASIVCRGTISESLPEHVLELRDVHASYRRDEDRRIPSGRCPFICRISSSSSMSHLVMPAAALCRAVRGCIGSIRRAESDNPF